MLACNKHLQPVTIGKDSRVPAGPVRRVRTEVPTETRVDHGTQFWLALREVEGSAELRDAKDVGDAGSLHRVVRIDEACVIKGAPCDDAANAGIGGRPAVGLRVSYGLQLLRYDVARAPIVAVEA